MSNDEGSPRYVPDQSAVDEQVQSFDNADSGFGPAHFSADEDPSAKERIDKVGKVMDRVFAREQAKEQVQRERDNLPRIVDNDIMARFNKGQGRLVCMPLTTRDEGGNTNTGFGMVGFALSANEEGTRHYIYTRNGEEIVTGPPSGEDAEARYKGLLAPTKKLPFMVKGDTMLPDELADALNKYAAGDLRVIHTNASKDGASEVAQDRKRAFELAGRNEALETEKDELRLQGMRDIVKDTQGDSRSQDQE